MRQNKLFHGVTLIFALGIFLSVLFPTDRVQNLDMGPKPKVVVELQGIDDLTVYGTFIVRESGTPLDGSGRIPEEIREQFQRFQDVEKGSHVELSYLMDCTGSHRLLDAYMPPESFQVLLYFPEQNTFVRTEETFTKYDFYSSYTLELGELNLQEVRNTTVTVSGSMYSHEGKDRLLMLADLCARVFFTVLIELWVGIRFFGIQKKRSRCIIVAANIVTQFSLLFYMVRTYAPGLAFFVIFPVGEFVVFVAEAVLYRLFFQKEDRTPRQTYLYALEANLLTVVVGEIWHMVAEMLR